MFDTNDWNRVMNQLRVKLTGASDNIIKAEMYETLSQFFDMSNSWMEDLTILTSQDTRTYDVVPAEEGQVVRLAAVTDANGFGVPALMPTPGTIVLRDPPNANMVLTVTVIKNVTLPNTSDMVPVGPDWALKLYAPYIIAGCLGNLMASSNASWTDPKNAARNLSKFQAGISMARSDTLRRRAIGAQAWRFPQTFATRTQRGGVSVGNSQRF